MNGRIAKKIRKIIYQDVFSSHHREYTDVVNPRSVPQTVVRHADNFRISYQKAKKQYKELIGEW